MKPIMIVMIQKKEDRLIARTNATKVHQCRKIYIILHTESKNGCCLVLFNLKKKEK